MYLRHLFAYQEAARRVQPHAVLVDIGCGEGYGTDVLARTVRLAVGVDVDPPTIVEASRRYGRDSCRYLVYDGTRLPFVAAGFDAATAFQVIEHVSDEQHFVTQAARLLRPGGLFILTTPNRLLRLNAGERPWNRYHLREYSPDDLRDALVPHFGRVEILGVEGDAETQAHELERLAWVRRTAARDPLRLRRFLSERMKRWLLSMLRGQVTGRGDEPVVGDWKTGRYGLTDKAAASLDLFAVCNA